MISAANVGAESSGKNNSYKLHRSPVHLSSDTVILKDWLFTVRSRRTSMNFRSLKSVHITNYYHKDSGGISTAYNKLLEAANRHGREVRLIVPGETDDVEDIGEFGRIYYVKALQSPVVDSRYRLITPLNYVPIGSPIRKILSAEMPDIVEIGEKYLLSALAGVIRTGHFKELGRPLLIHFSHERMDDNLRAFLSKTKILNWFSQQFIRNYILPSFDYHIANSNYTAGELTIPSSETAGSRSPSAFSSFCYRMLNTSNNASTDNVKVSNCGVDFEFFNSHRKNNAVRKAILDEALFPEDAKIILYAGRISPEKNVAILPAILELLQKANSSTNGSLCRLLILGNGPKSDWLEEQLRQVAPGKYKLMGHLTDKNKMAEIYTNSDVFLHPNPREPFGIGPLEAMASGLPCVLPNAGGVLSYANPDNAWLVDPEPGQFVEAILGALSNEAERDRRIQNGLETAKDNSWVRSTDRLFNLYDEIYSEFKTSGSEVYHSSITLGDQSIVA